MMQQPINEESANHELQQHYADMQARQSTAKSDHILSLLLAAGATIVLVLMLIKLS
jgi:beta-lactamase regulating signal transducer with metallopeptidase domain